MPSAKPILDGVYISYALAIELIDNHGVKSSLKSFSQQLNMYRPVAFYWDLWFDTIEWLACTLVTEEDELARTLMLLPDKATRIYYLNNH